MLNRGRLIVALLFFALFSVTLTYNSPVPKPSDLQRIISSLEDKSLILALNPHFQLLLRSLEDYYFKICEELDKGDLVSAEYYYSRFTAAWRAALLEEKLFASKFALFLIICMLIFNLALLFFSMTYARNLKPRIMEHTVLNLVFTGVIAWIYPEGALKAITGFIEGPRLGLNLDSVMLFVLSPLAFMVSPVLVLSKEFLKAVVASKVRRVTFRDVKLDRWNELPIYFPRRAFNRVVDFIVKSLSRYDPYSRIRFSVERFSRSEDRAFILLHFIDLTIEASILVNLRVLCRDEKCIILFKPVSPIGRWGIAERSTLTVFLRAFRKSLLQLQWQLKRESRAS